MPEIEDKKGVVVKFDPIEYEALRAIGRSVKNRLFRSYPSHVSKHCIKSFSVAGVFQ